jgi:hypothetical protein
MTQPDYVPITESDQVRRTDVLRTPEPWSQDRPAELVGARRPSGRMTGTPGPDQGYALSLAGRFEDRLVLAEGETAEDAIAGCVGVALRRAAVFGRAPVAQDLELAFTLWGFLGGAPPDLVEHRRRLFQGASHHYWDQRAISEKVPESTLRMTPAQVAENVDGWAGLVEV